jgi:hypothetical protein
MQRGVLYKYMDTIDSTQVKGGSSSGMDASLCVRTVRIVSYMSQWEGGNNKEQGTNNV